MNLNRLINMILGQLVRRATTWGVNKGIDLAAGKGKPADQMTPAERRMARQARQAARTARKTARLTRRF